MSIEKESKQPPNLSIQPGIRFNRRHFVAVFLVFTAVVFFAFQVFLSIRYKNDSYSHLAQSQLAIAAKHLGGYRFIPAINMLLYSLANVKDVDVQMLNTVCLLIGLSLSASILFFSLCKKLCSLSWAKLALLAFAVALAYVNPFVAAMALFPETGMFMGAGYLLATLAAVLFARKFSIGNCLASFALLFCALGTYQALLGMFAFAAFSLLIAEYGLARNRETVKRAVVLVLIAGIASIANILIGKALCSLFGVVQNTRTDGFSIQRILTNLLSLLEQQRKLWYDLLQTTPRLIGMFACALLMLCIFINFIIKSIRKVRDKELSVSKLIADILFFILMFAFCYATVFAPFMLATSAGIIPRGILSFFGVFLLLTIMQISTTDSAWQHYVSAVAIGVLLFFCILSVTRIGIEQNIVNALDREYAQQVIYHIKSYEQETGATITKIAIVNDEDPVYFYESADHYCAPFIMLSKSARVVENSQVNFIKMYSGRNFERISMPKDVFAAYFKVKDWDFFVPSEQIIFQGDTVYIAAY